MSHPLYLDGLLLTETSDSTSNGDGTSGVQAISTSSVLLSASLAEPDADGRSLHASLSAELAGVLGVLRDLHLLHLLTERGTITGSVLSDDSNLLRSLRLQDKKKRQKFCQ